MKLGYMLNKLTLRDRLFLISSLLVLVAIALIWIFIKPQYQETVVKERTTIVSQLQEYALRQTDHVIRNWLNATIRLQEDLTLNPGKAPEIANRAINYTSGLMRVLISDTENSEFQNVDFFIAERAFQIGANVFKLRLYFNAQSLNDNLISIPLGGTYFTNILSASGKELLQLNDFRFPNDLIGANSFSNQRVINIGDKNWFVLSSRFETIPFWHLIAVENAFILEPVNQLIRFSFYTVMAVLLLMLLFSWYVSLRVNKPIKLLLEDVEYLGNLDFDHRIKQVLLPEFKPMHDTFENIRTTLSRYQKLNVEKIILEEWKINTW